MRIGLATLASVIVLTAAAHAGAFDEYLIFHGQGGATQITTLNGVTTVNAVDNDINGAVGTISPVTKGPYQGEMAFHGTLNGKPDPDPKGIGWGLVKKAPGTGGILDKSTDLSLDFEFAAHALIGMPDSCGAGAQEEIAITNAVTTVGVLQTQVQMAVMNGYTSAKKGKQHIKSVQELSDMLVSYKQDIVNSGVTDSHTFDQFIKKLTSKKKKHKKFKKKWLKLLLELEQCGILY